MALSNIFGWNKEDDKQKSAACGTACGAAAPEEKTAACGTACGAAAPEEKPTACGTACGAADK